LLLDTQIAAADLNLGSRELSLEVGADAGSPRGSLIASRTAHELFVDTGTVSFTLSTRASAVLSGATVTGRAVLNGDASVVRVTGADGRPWTVTWRNLDVEHDGRLRSAIVARGDAVEGASSVTLFLRLEFFANTGAVRVRLSIRNHHRAAHPGGIWELGDAGSVLLGDVSLLLAGAEAASAVEWSAEPGAQLAPARNVHIYQESSGGQNWSSTNHVDRSGTVPLRYSGYRVDCDGASLEGGRATPTVIAHTPAGSIAATVPHFWQNFPRALDASGGGVRVGFFPSDAGRSHELQGGEQKTHECYVVFGASGDAAHTATWCRCRSVLHPTPEWYEEAAAATHLVMASDEARAYRALVDAAIEGSDTFTRKREVADEYGWRHFGDIYGDHEAVFAKTASPLMSHYNNQYDPVAGFLSQFMRTGDDRWWFHCAELAAHVADIDVYNTDEDKSAYNHGLFWHTYHYVDAAKATHRSYPTGTVGGGPSSEQNYPTGLMLYHFITGDTIAREAALGLAQFVVDADDGARTVFRLLDRGYTGISSASRTPDYHGPGRGSGNSVSALVDGHRLTGDRAYLDKAEQIIRRCAHPRQDIESLQLLDAENRWFYTMYLQALGKYLEWKVALGELDAMYAYGRDVLLHFARWMAAHERPYLDHPEILEYPTETWPAQDIRKSEIFDIAARHASETERPRFLERAAFFFDYSTHALGEMPTRALARPVVLLLVHGSRRAHTVKHGVSLLPPAADSWEGRWPSPQRFVPQKIRAKRRAVQIAAAGAALGAVGIGGLLMMWLG
jgi:hypothetical protein